MVIPDTTRTWLWRRLIQERPTGRPTGVADRTGEHVILVDWYVQDVR